MVMSPAPRFWTRLGGGNGRGCMWRRVSECGPGLGRLRPITGSAQTHSTRGKSLAVESLEDREKRARGWLPWLVCPSISGPNTGSPHMRLRATLGWRDENLQDPIGVALSARHLLAVVLRCACVQGFAPHFSATTQAPRILHSTLPIRISPWLAAPGRSAASGDRHPPGAEATCRIQLFRGSSLGVVSQRARAQLVLRKLQMETRKKAGGPAL
ncbi:hypothetical protein VUR80DRAFT_7253 [Thermomyces stellatus]